MTGGGGVTGQVDVSIGAIDKSLRERQGFRAGIKYLPEPGTVSWTLFNRPGHFGQAMEPVSTVLRFLILSHKQP